MINTVVSNSMKINESENSDDTKTEPANVIYLLNKW